MQVFAPANLRAAADNKAYADFVSACIADKYTLRYTGGFVPDINHIMAKVTSLADCEVLHQHSCLSKVKRAHSCLASAELPGVIIMALLSGCALMSCICAQGGGLFVNPASTSAPAKLRLLYECAPLALIVEAAGGASSNGKESILSMQIDSLDRRTAITLGSQDEVARSEHCLQV